MDRVIEWVNPDVEIRYRLEFVEEYLAQPRIELNLPSGLNNPGSLQTVRHRVTPKILIGAIRSMPWESRGPVQGAFFLDGMTLASERAAALKRALKAEAELSQTHAELLRVGWVSPDNAAALFKKASTAESARRGIEEELVTANRQVKALSEGQAVLRQEVDDLERANTALRERCTNEAQEAQRLISRKGELVTGLQLRIAELERELGYVAWKAGGSDGMVQVPGGLWGCGGSDAAIKVANLLSRNDLLRQEAKELERKLKDATSTKGLISSIQALDEEARKVVLTPFVASGWDIRGSFATRAAEAEQARDEAIAARDVTSRRLEDARGQIVETRSTLERVSRQRDAAEREALRANDGWEKSKLDHEKAIRERDEARVERQELAGRVRVLEGELVIARGITDGACRAVVKAAQERDAARGKFGGTKSWMDHAVDEVLPRLHETEQKIAEMTSRAVELERERDSYRDALGHLQRADAGVVTLLKATELDRDDFARRLQLSVGEVVAAQAERDEALRQLEKEKERAEKAERERAEFLADCVKCGNTIMEPPAEKTRDPLMAAILKPAEPEPEPELAPGSRWDGEEVVDAEGRRFHVRDGNGSTWLCGYNPCDGPLSYQRLADARALIAHHDRRAK